MSERKSLWDYTNENFHLKNKDNTDLLEKSYRINEWLIKAQIPWKSLLDLNKVLLYNYSN